MLPQGPFTQKLRFPQAPMVLGTPKGPAIRLVAWPVMHMAMNRAWGSFRVSSTVRGGLGLLLLRE